MDPFEKAAQDYRSIRDFDPLAAAEDLLGGRNAESTALGFMMHIQHNEAKVAMLKKMGDTHFGTSFTEFQALAIQMGFVEVYSEDFGEQEQWKLFWNSLGVLLQLESYSGSTNTANIYFNWKSSSPDKFERPQRCSNGVIMKDDNNRVDLTDDTFLAWDCHDDVREGFFSIMMDLSSEGYFCPRWFKAPFLWFSNYLETKNPNHDYRAVRDRKFALLPVHVQDAIGDPAGVVRNLELS
jgi:hypothetical protein